MNAIGFGIEWHDGGGIEGPELAATFASLRIEVHGDLLTRVLDGRARTSRDSVYVPLYPLAEWLVSNWWFLAYEFENRIKRTNPAFAQRHSLVAAGEGYAYPDLTISSSGSRTQITWSMRTPRWAKIRFLNSGTANVHREQFMQEAAKMNELRFAADLGRIHDRTHTPAPPWRAGCELARRTRAELGLNGRPIASTASLARTLDKDIRVFRRVTQPVAPLKRLPLIDGLATTGSSSSLSLGLSATSGPGKRFVFCRALAEAMTTRGDSLITKANTERQQRNRAFAAEFLAPSASLQKRISHGLVDEEQITDASSSSNTPEDGLSSGKAVSSSVRLPTFRHYEVESMSPKARRTLIWSTCGTAPKRPCR